MQEDTNPQQKRRPGRPSNAERASMQAQHNPVVSHSNVDYESNDFVNRVTEDASFIPEFEEAVDYRHMKFTLTAPQVQTVTETEFKTLAEQEKFMQDMLVVEIHKSGDKNAPPQVAIGLNGDICWLPRGRKIKLPRGLLGVLLQSQERTYTTERNQDPNADEGYVAKAANSLCYPVNVLYDPRPAEGRRWMRRVTAQA